MRYSKAAKRLCLLLVMTWFLAYVRSGSARIFGACEDSCDSRWRTCRAAAAGGLSSCIYGAGETMGVCTENVRHVHQELLDACAEGDTQCVSDADRYLSETWGACESTFLAGMSMCSEVANHDFQQCENDHDRCLQDCEDYGGGDFGGLQP